MAPLWVAADSLPYGKMWADDPLWYPVFLSDRHFVGVFAFRETHKMVWNRLRVVEDVAAHSGSIPQLLAELAASAAAP